MKANNSDNPGGSRLAVTRLESGELEDFDYEFDEDFEAEMVDEWPDNQELEEPLTEEALQKLASQHMVTNNRPAQRQARQREG